MQSKIRIGLVGLGGIAQKAYLPILTKELDWVFVGAFTPNKEKRERICQQYRINSFDSLTSLQEACDAIFVHSSTESHFEVVSFLLSNGVDVYVDKPLAANGIDAEQLVEISEKNNRKLMVGFNRRFAPMYLKAKALAGTFDVVHMEKHRPNDVGPNDYSFTMLDDYLHVVDTLRWLGNGDIKLTDQFNKINSYNQLLFTHHSFQKAGQFFTSSMHRQAGSSLEQLELITNDKIVRVRNMNTLEVESNQQITTETPGSWETILETRGFKDCIHHFIGAVVNDKRPEIDGQEALKSQLLVEALISNIDRNK
ncbi:Gfo/Idh/MocA family protein [Radiobacillus sp. PE A8.2]|uniref:Gfo/Idh/MocA family protein n=1 Tax=Radiobacillus sp. PE A8.2 TaxID=3380349 RepID=UPI00388D7A9B